MSNEARIEAYSSLPGYRLVDAKRVGLPVYAVSIDVLKEEKRPIHLVSEYCLRLIHRGVNQLDDIVALLGISRSVLRVALADLIRGNAVVGDEEDLRLGSIGKELLSELGEIVCVEGVWFVPYDGLLRKPYPWPREKLLTPHQLFDLGHNTEIAPFGNRPTARDLVVDDVWRALAELRSDKAPDRLLSVRNVRRAPLRFIAATALAYKSDGGMVHVRFFSDGRPLDAHASEFARAGGTKRPLLRKLATEDDDAVQSRAKVKRRLTRAMGGPPQLEGTLSLNGGAKPSEVDIKVPTVLEMPEALVHALANAKSRLVITSRGISPITVDKDFIASLESLLAKNVSVLIGLGPDVKTLADSGKRLDKALQALREMQASWPRLKIVSIPDLSSTHLIVDNKKALVGNYDWLSADGSNEHIFREKWALQVVHEVAVTKEAARLEGVA